MNIFRPIEKSNKIPLNFTQKMVKLVVVWAMIIVTFFFVIPNFRNTVINLQSPEILLQPNCNLSKLADNDVVLWKGKPTTVEKVNRYDSLNSINIDLQD